MSSPTTIGSHCVWRWAHKITSVAVAMVETDGHFGNEGGRAVEDEGAGRWAGADLAHAVARNGVPAVSARPGASGGGGSDSHLDEESAIGANCGADGRATAHGRRGPRGLGSVLTPTPAGWY